jgi:hypothetical protein
MGTGPGQEKRKEKGACDGLGQIDFRARRVLGFRIIFQILNQGFVFKIRGLNIFKPNLNYLQNKIKSNQIFGNFSNLEI